MYGKQVNSGHLGLILSLYYVYIVNIWAGFCSHARESEEAIELPIRDKFAE